MSYIESKSAPTVLRNHYEKLLFPYDVFQSGLMTGGDTVTEVKYIYWSWIQCIAYWYVLQLNDVKNMGHLPLNELNMTVSLDSKHGIIFTIYMYLFSK